MPQQLHVSRHLILANQLPELCQNHKQQMLSCKERFSWASYSKKRMSSVQLKIFPKLLNYSPNNIIPWVFFVSESRYKQDLKIHSLPQTRGCNANLNICAGAVCKWVIDCVSAHRKHTKLKVRAQAKMMVTRRSISSSVSCSSSSSSSKP